MTGTIADVVNARKPRDASSARMTDVHIAYGEILRLRERGMWDLAVRDELAEPGYAERLAMAHLGFAEQGSNSAAAREMSDDPKSNRLLAEVPEGDFQRWSPHLEAVGLSSATKVSARSGTAKTLSDLKRPGANSSTA